LRVNFGEVFAPLAGSAHRSLRVSEKAWRRTSENTSSRQLGE
jgi:hypothetical protein